MRTIFLADAHLTEPGYHNYRLLLKFLASLEGNTETLYIMGDLFDFWVGFPSQPFEQYNEVLDALASLKQSGCRLIYFEGNHDFHMGELFEKRLCAEVYPGPAIVNVQGRRLFLCHGDQINLEDRGYRFLRLILHGSLIKSIVRHFPPSLAMMIRRCLQHASRAGYEIKSSRWNYYEIIRSFAAAVREEGCDGLVTGHFHLAFCEQLNDSGFTILSLGDWMVKFTYGEIVDGMLLLHNFDPSPESDNRKPFPIS